MNKLHELEYDIQITEMHINLINQEIHWHLSNPRESGNSHDFSLGFLVGMNQIKNVLISKRERLKTKHLELAVGVD